MNFSIRFFFNISRRSAVEVLHIFHRHGPPSKERAYLFNGDISDRGAEAGQTMLRVDAVLVVGKTTKKSKWMLLDVVGCCWMLLDVVGCCWMLLDVVGCCWRSLDVVGCCWMLLEVIGCYWMLLDVVGCCWMLLEVIGCCWMLLDVIGGYWRLLEVVGCCWMCWMLLDVVGCCWMSFAPSKDIISTCICYVRTCLCLCGDFFSARIFVAR